ncbi:Acyl-CoA dehydrogenase [Ruegeria sp. THAF57]|uniref:acyl-CoA dehydrogenase C-terminal domain-containing protein n=1 Tax=Ruegeria sp. THAF57 TaxID=2744555 RepID=UPI0015DF7309|nr:acyl-CoA dehydrogenase C-terminal domain-containing protein [Ruegeria sp. THAF57]CAD0187238.1 Acyl-CoA dehydrogenase [Ruegeria sp. THAF57]
MPSYTAPTKDYAYLTQDVFDLSSQNIPGYEDLDRDFTTAVIGEAGKLASEVMSPVNQTGDQEGCTLENGVVRTPTGFSEAFDALRDGGWPGIDMPEEYGGQNMPFVMHTAVNQMFSAANHALIMYPGLTHGAASALLAHASDEQKNTYLPNMVSCKWTGTMNLTEPHCGTDLGLLRTKAEPQEDGTYKVSGQKIFISSGDHDMAENIIHLVLAKIPGEPNNVKGISLFIVPKFLVNEDGSLGARNGVSVGNLEKKMGIHGNATCVMNYDGATGYLVGEVNKGMRAMFTMMNEARIGAALQGVSAAELGYQNALAYAKDRLQGRDVTGVKNPEGPADPLIVHPDIRRNLMDQKSFVEAGRALGVWSSMKLDQAHRNNDADALALISLLTPVMKGFCSDKGFDMAVQSQQILGGHGYIEEWGLSQCLRDARIAQIYEGANGIQALDLVARKLPSDNGKAFRDFIALVSGFIAEHKDDETIGAEVIAPLKAALNDLQTAAMTFVQNGMKDINATLSGSYDFMHLFGHVLLGYMWGLQAVASQAALAAGSEDPAFHDAKLLSARFYNTRHLPMTATHLARIKTTAAPVMEMDVEAF